MRKKYTTWSKNLDRYVRHGVKKLERYVRNGVRN